MPRRTRRLACVVKGLSSSVCMMMTIAIGVISIIFQPSVLKPYRSRLANLLETAININFLFLMLINATLFFHDDFFTFSSLTESSSSSECACNPELFKKVHGLQLYACACGCLHYKYSSSIFKVHVCNVSYLMKSSASKAAATQAPSIGR